MTEAWSPSSWQRRDISQHPHYEDSAGLARVKERLATLPPLVSAREIQKLTSRLGEVARGHGFLLQGGDCAESFSEYNQENLLAYFRVMLQMAVTLVYGARRPVVKVGRIAGQFAGQFAKPRSEEHETRDGVSLPSYRGDMINGIEFDPTARNPDPNRLLSAYSQSASTLNYLHALARDGYAALANVAKWNSEFLRKSRGHDRYVEVVERIREYIAFVEACGVSATESEALGRSDFFTSHEALLLHYEEGLTRLDEATGAPFACSAHMLWIGNRTRQPNRAHVEFLRGVGNPLGIKIGPGMPPDELMALLDVLNPDNIPGRITLISRMGAQNIETALPPLVQRVEQERRVVVWACDPMHGNTVKSSNGYKTRRFDDILAEVQTFFAVHRASGTHPGGVHFEMTGQNVTECVGGSDVVSEENLDERYHTHCDPRLNASQALELAFLVAEELRRS